MSYPNQFLVILLGIGVFFLRLSVCRFCPKNWIYRPGSSSCYLITTSVRRPWAEAQQACQANGAYLLKLENKEERLWIIKELGKVQATDPLRSSEWWLGLNDRNKTMKWVWTDGTPVNDNAIVWNDYEPNNWGGLEWCCELWGHGLNDKPCSAVQSYICERPHDLPVKCDNDRGWEEYSGTCYKYFSEELDWFNAKLTCEESDSRLVTVEDRKAQFYINDISLLKKKQLWFGLTYEESDADENYQWNWVDGKPLSLHYWNEGRYPVIEDSVKNDSCAYVDPFVATGNNWLPGRCYEAKPFVCQKKIGTCQDGWELHQESCFQFNSNYRLSQPQAEKYCRDQGGHLADIDSSYDQTFFNSKLNELSSLGVRKIWLGLTLDADGHYIWNSGEELTYTNWKIARLGIEDNSDQMKCIVINTEDINGEWEPTSSCAEQESFVCEIKVGTKVKKAKKPPLFYRCIEGWVSFNNYCYLFNNTRSTWIGAKSSCRQQKSHLVKVDDKDTQLFINTMSRKNQWIGLNDRAQEGVMIWDNDGTKLSQDSYTNWLDEEPNNQEGHENCVVIFNRKPASAKWADFDCNRKFSFICQRLAENVPTFAPPMTLKPSIYDPRCGPEWEIGPTRSFCYHFSDEQLSWFDARVTCYHHGGELASITEKSEQYFIAGRIRIFSSIALWLGANDLTREAEWNWNDYSPMSFFNWGTGQPDNVDKKENCALIAKATSYWYDSDCRSRNGYICKKKAIQLEPTTTPVPVIMPTDYYYHCAEGWKIFNDKCYKVIEETYSWHDARMNCRKMGGDLLSIDTESEQMFAKSLLENDKGIYYWIGLNDINHKGTYTWSHGNKVLYTDWLRGEPDRLQGPSCVAMLFLDGKWGDYDCSHESKSICQKNLEYSKREEGIGCLPGYVMSGSTCYKFVNILKIHEEAEAYCRHVLNAQLPVVNNSLIQIFLAQNKQRQKRLRYWISTASKRGSFKFWMKDRKAKDGDGWCLSFAANFLGSWESVPCNIKANFICSRPLSRLPSTDSTEMSTILPMTPETTFPETTTDTTTLSITSNQTNILCPYEWKYYNGHCYRGFSGSITGASWTNAREYCLFKDADLISIKSEEEMQFLRDNFLKRKPNSAFWTGARISNNELIGWSDESKVDFFPPLYGKVTPTNTRPCTIILYSSHSLVLRTCSMRSLWICKMKPHDPKEKVLHPQPVYCNDGARGKWVHHNGSCYISPYDFEKDQWYDSKDTCQFFGSQLASIHSLEENEYIVHTFHTNMWIGMYFQYSVYVRKWFDGSKIDFTNWDEGEPKDISEKPCVAITPDTGKWRTYSCYQRLPSLCKRYENHDLTYEDPKRPKTGGCPKGFVAYDAKCFFIGGTQKDEQLSWEEAREKCRSFGLLFDLATISNRWEEAFIIQRLYQLKTSLWIGLRMEQGSYTWQDHSRLSYLNLEYGHHEKLFRTNYGHCIAMHTEKTAAGFWFVAFCNQKAGYICQGYRNDSIPTEVEKEASPKPGYTKYRDSYYKYFNDSITWSEAEDFCQLDGGHLVSIEDIYEEAFLYSFIKGIDFFWIGAKQKNGKVSWSDNSSVLYTNWGFGGDDDNCGVFSDPGIWYISDCQESHNFICKISPNKTKEDAKRVTEKMESSVNGSCPEGWIAHDKHCYFYANRKQRSWPEAIFECEKMGANLASFHSEEAVAFSRVLTHSYPATSVGLWIGLTFQDGALTWSDKSPVDYMNFMNGEMANKGDAKYATGIEYREKQDITRDCWLLFIRTGLWRRASCFTRVAFLCMLPKRVNDVLDTVTPETCIDCYKNIPVTEKPVGLTTAQVVGIILVVPTVMVLSAIIAYFVIKRKTVRLTTDGRGFVNSLYEAPNFMSLKEDMEKNQS